MHTVRILLFAALLAPTFSLADTVIVVNAKGPIGKLSLKQVTDIYLGRERTANGQILLPLDHPIASPLRAKFFLELTGKSINQVNTYWARLVFTGQASPPLQMPDAKSVLDMVKSNLNAIAYLETDPGDKDLRIVLTLPPRAKP